MCQEDDERMTFATIRDMPDRSSITSSVTLPNMSVALGKQEQRTDPGIAIPDLEGTDCADCVRYRMGRPAFG